MDGFKTDHILFQFLSTQPDYKLVLYQEQFCSAHEQGTGLVRVTAGDAPLLLPNIYDRPATKLHRRHTSVTIPHSVNEHLPLDQPDFNTPVSDVTTLQGGTSAPAPSQMLSVAGRCSHFKKSLSQ